MRFHNRADAGRSLAELLGTYAGRPDVQILGLPRGGVPVAFEVADALRVSLDVFVVRKLGVPGQEELAMGAVASGGVLVLNDDVVRALGISRTELDQVTEAERRELARRERLYRGTRPPIDVVDRTAILIDDGLATGSTMRAAVAALRSLRPRRLVVAVPVASAKTCSELKGEVEEIVCARTPEPFYAVGSWYKDFPQTGDAEVTALLERAASRTSPTQNSSR
jgi:putative phosphoribosyl transferase